MSVESPVQIAPPIARPQSFGSFDRMPEPPPAPNAWRSESWCKVIGREGSAHQGIIAIANYREVLPGSGAETQELLDRFRTFRLANPSEFVQHIESGVNGNVAFVVEEPAVGSRLSDLLTVQRRFTIASVSELVSNLALALQKSHEAGFVHGRIDSFSVVREGDDTYLLGGFLPESAAKPETDVVGLAGLAISAIIGKPRSLTSAPEQPVSIAVERLRGEIDGLHEHVATTLIRGTRTGDIDSFSTPIAFADALQQSVKTAALDVVAGAWESISRQDFAMATLLLGMAENYDPHSEELTLLRLRLKGDALRDPAMTAAAIWDARHEAVAPAGAESPPSPAMIAPLNQENDSFGLGTTTLTPELEKLLAGPPLVKKQGKGLNTWALFGIGVLVMVLILIVLVATAFTQLT